MWRNTDVAAMIEWMRKHNECIEKDNDRAGFYGLDLYNMRGSIAAVLEYLDKVDPNAAKVARERYGCLTPWQREPSSYGRAVLTQGYRECKKGRGSTTSRASEARARLCSAGRRGIP